MSTTTITAGQSLLDVALQECGSAAAVYALATANGLAVTDLLAPGQLLATPTPAAPDVVSYFTSRAQRINTGDQVLVTDTPPATMLDHHELDFSDLDYA